MSQRGRRLKSGILNSGQVVLSPAFRGMPGSEDTQAVVRPPRPAGRGVVVDGDDDGVAAAPCTLLSQAAGRR
jgi:hypothetical protein